MRTILISLAVAVFVIGVHQTMTVGPQASYFIYMIALALIFVARLVKGKESSDTEPKPDAEKPKLRSEKKK